MRARIAFVQLRAGELLAETRDQPSFGKEALLPRPGRQRHDDAPRTGGRAQHHGPDGFCVNGESIVSTTRAPCALEHPQCGLAQLETAGSGFA